MIIVIIQSKKGVTEHIEEMLAKDSFDKPENLKEWELKLEKKDIRVWVKKIPKGVTNEHPYIKTEILYNSAFAMHKIIEAVREFFLYNIDLQC